MSRDNLGPCGTWGGSGSAPFGHFHGHSHQQAATEPTALAKAFIETLKTIPEPPTGGRSIEWHPCRAKGGVKPRCGGQEQRFGGEHEADGYQVSLCSTPLTPANPKGQGVGLGLGSSDMEVREQLRTDSYGPRPENPF